MRQCSQLTVSTDIFCLKTFWQHRDDNITLLCGLGQWAGGRRGVINSKVQSYIVREPQPEHLYWRKIGWRELSDDNVVGVSKLITRDSQMRTHEKSVDISTMCEARLEELDLATTKSIIENKSHLDHLIRKGKGERSGTWPWVFHLSIFTWESSELLRSFTQAVVAGDSVDLAELLGLIF